MLSSENLTREDVVLLLSNNELLQNDNTKLRTEVNSLKSQLLWFQKQIFGTKSERRIITPPSNAQLCLGETISKSKETLLPEPADTVKSYARRKSKKEEIKENSAETLLRFDPSVPVEEVQIPVKEIEGLSPDQYEIIDHEVSYKLAQTPSSYVVIKYIRPVVKIKESETIHTAPMPPMVVERSFSDVSFYAGERLLPCTSCCCFCINFSN